MALFVAWASFPSDIAGIGNLIGSLISVTFVTALIGGPIVLIATALFGTPAAVLVDRSQMGRIAALITVIVFAALPVAFLLWSTGSWDNGDEEGKSYNDLIVLCAVFALPAALTLWRGLMRKRQTF